MVVRHARKTQPATPEQLDLPGTRVEPAPPSVEERLEWAIDHIHEQEDENAVLRQHLTELRTELREAKEAQGTAVRDRLTAEKALSEARSQIRLLQTLSDGLGDLLRQKAREALPADQAWLLQEITRFLTICHPDKWQGSPVAEELTKAVLVVRQRLQGKTSGRHAGMT
jgi:phage shock protein A